jgi:hypothetical protein
MRAAGENLTAIGRALGRRHNSIVGGLHTLAKNSALEAQAIAPAAASSPETR